MNSEAFSKNENHDVQRLLIYRIKELIRFKNLEPGDKLPSERNLSEKFGVSRGNIRAAIKKLEFYGILISKPQSGTFIADIGAVAMEGILEDILNLDNPDFKSLVETRILLELKTVRLAALRRTEDDLIQLKKALDTFVVKVKSGLDAVQEDLLFHLAIARASGNSTLNTFMLIITPEIIRNFEKYHVCDTSESYLRISEHTEIYQAILDQNPSLAKEKMKIHFKVLYQYGNQITKN